MDKVTHGNAGALYSQDRNSLLPEHAHQGNEGQADQGVGVVAFHAADECDAQSFRFRAAGAVIGLFLAQVSLDLVVAEVTESDAIFHHFALHCASTRIQQGQPSIKDHAVPTHGAQLQHGVVMGKGLAHALLAQQDDLIRAYDQRLRVMACHCARLFAGQPPGGFTRALVRERGFIHVGRGGLKRDLQAL